jgi:mRNA interferase RelE/StbE
MAKYKIIFKKSVLKDLKPIPTADIKKILACIDTLADNPMAQGCIELTGKDQYRIRLGNYRIVYEIQNDILVVLIIKVGHRSSVYSGD